MVTTRLWICGSSLREPVQCSSLPRKPEAPRAVPGQTQGLCSNNTLSLSAEARGHCEANAFVILLLFHHSAFVIKENVYQQYLLRAR